MFVLLYVIWARVINLVEILLVIYALLSWFPGAIWFLLVLIFQLSQLYFC